MLLLGFCIFSPTVAGCSGPTAPSGTGPPAVVRLEVAGPATMAPGEGARFMLKAILSNGSESEITNEAVWTSLTTSILTVEQGLVTAHNPGDGSIRAAARGLTVSAAVIVVPAGTFRVTGRVIVSDNDARISYPLAGGTVEIVSADGTRLITSTDGAGTYRVYGVAGRVDIKVTKPGFVPVARTVDVTGHQTVDFEVNPAGTEDHE